MQQKVRIVGLEQFGLNESSFRRLDNRKVEARISLRTYDLTPAVRRLLPSKRLPYMAARAERWIQKLRARYPGVLFRPGGARTKQRPPASLSVQCSAREVLALARSKEIASVYVEKVGGRRQQAAEPHLEWYCVRALVGIRIEGMTSGRQATEDRFVLVRASSFKDATKRLKRHWREYAKPYMNSAGRLVSWRLDHVVDVYLVSEKDIDPAGTEVYSKLGHRRMRQKYVWRPKL